MRQLRIFVSILLAELAHGYLYSYPVFQQRPGLKKSKVGNPVKFNCEVDQTDAKLYWEFNGWPIESNDYFHITPVGSTSILYIKSVLLELEGGYCCNLNNGYRIWSECGELIVKRGPSIIRGPVNQSAHLGQDATFNCTVDSYPRSKIAWLHNGTAICKEKTNKECRQTSKDNKPQVGFLRITNVSQQDSGLYQCKAMNNLSTEYSNDAVLYVKEKRNMIAPTNKMVTTKPNVAEVLEFYTDSISESRENEIATNILLRNDFKTTQSTTTMDYYHLPAMNNTSHKVFSYSDEDYHNRLPSPNSTILIVLFLGLALVVTFSVFIFCVARKKMAARKTDERVKIARLMSQRRLASSKEQSILRSMHYPVEDLEITQELGEGVFGLVFKANAPGLISFSETTTVAVKTIRSTDQSDYSRVEDFNREAEMLATFKHKNIIQLLGVCVENDSPLESYNISCLLFEYVDGGDLCAYLRNRGPNKILFNSHSDVSKQTLSDQDKLRICTHIACGMQYLSERNFIHRDLATRNCLISERDLNIKISDFGLSRRTYESDYYKAGETESVPIRWMSPEAILYGKYSSQSDIWAYGVTLWEVYSYALQPYFSLTNEEVICCICKNQILSCPSDTPNWIYNLMKLCWQNAPDERPNFQTIHSVLQAIAANRGELPLSEINHELAEFDTSPPDYNTVTAHDQDIQSLNSSLATSINIPPPIEFDSSRNLNRNSATTNSSLHPHSGAKTRSISVCDFSNRRSKLAAANARLNPHQARSISVITPPRFPNSSSNYRDSSGSKYFNPMHAVIDARSDSCLPDSPSSSNYGSDKESVV